MYFDLHIRVVRVAHTLSRSLAEGCRAAPGAAAGEELRRAALRARRQEKDAKTWAMWASQGWSCSSWQEKQIILLETGELAKQVRSANAAYGFGKGAEKALSREEAMTLEVYTNQVLNEYMK